MRNEQRAKIFAPFNPLTGLDEAYRIKERITVPRAELLCDRIEDIDRKLQLLRIGSPVRIVYYDGGEYKKQSGRVTHISPLRGIITVKTPVAFGDIYDIEIYDSEINRQAD